MGKPEVLYGFGMMGAGSLIGLTASAALVASGQVPAAFWLITFAVLVMTIISFAATAVLWVHGRRMASAPGLDLVFSGPGTQCVLEFSALVSDRTFKAEDGTISQTFSFPGRQEPATLVRLRAKNLRPHRLRRVRVEVLDAREAGAPVAYSSWLKWMHDDGPGSPESVQGTEIDPLGDEFLDLAMKAHPYPEISLEYAMPHLRRSAPLVGPLWVLLSASAIDAETDRRVPECVRGFCVEPTADGGLTVVPAEIAPPDPAHDSVAPTLVAGDARISLSANSAESVPGPFAAPTTRPRPNRSSRRARGQHQ
jgi:hypothetical protein